MMRTKKNGDPALPKDVLETAMNEHFRFAARLEVVLEDHVSEATGPLGDALRKLVVHHKSMGESLIESIFQTKRGNPRRKVVLSGGARLKALMLKRSPGRPRKRA